MPIGQRSKVVAGMRDRQVRAVGHELAERRLRAAHREQGADLDLLRRGRGGRDHRAGQGGACAKLFEEGHGWGLLELSGRQRAASVVTG
jgi:hypothetical protein